MKVIIKKLIKDSEMISNVQNFLFNQIKKEFGYDYVPEWHQDIVNMEKYYINPKRNNFFIAYNENCEIIATIGIRSYDKNFPQFRGQFSNDTGVVVWLLRCLVSLKVLQMNAIMKIFICILIKHCQGLLNSGLKWASLLYWIPMMN